MIEIEVKVGALELIAQGLIITQKGTPTELAFGGLTFRFLFEKKASNPEMHAEVQTEGKTATFHFYNITGGYGLENPAEVGNFKNKRLYFAYRIEYHNENSGYLFHYNIYLGEAIA